jgi:hypothetical protein
LHLTTHGNSLAGDTRHSRRRHDDPHWRHPNHARLPLRDRSA